MKYCDLALGIDTGGTYTDGVLLDISSGDIIKKAKAFTTREDLSVGIRNCIANLQWQDWKRIGLVSLSTTLATNAIVEGRGCKVGAVLIGHEPIEKIPANYITVIEGGHDLKGQPLVDMDIDSLRQSIQEMKGQVDTVAISGYLSIRNPEHELTARKIIREVLGVPVVCAHDLSSELGFHERTVTACLNARLLPVIAELLEAVKQVMADMNIKVPLMIVKGDGSLMSEEMTREKPVETILSGPAASIVGATYLTKSTSAVVVDMGGTTTDIAVIEDGRPKLKKEGAVVGGWRTMVEAADINTFGLGGDSYIQIERNGNLKLGPKRVWPISVIAERFPYINNELAEADPFVDFMGGQPVDCWMLLNSGKTDSLSETEKKIMYHLQDGPHTAFTLAKKIKLDPLFLYTKNLEEAHLVGRISFTPTDVLHALGKFNAWNTEAAQTAAEILSRRAQMSLDGFLEEALRQVEKNIAIDIMQSLIWGEGHPINLNQDKGAELFFNRFIEERSDKYWSVGLGVNLPIVAIGAPVPAYFPKVGQMLHSDICIPNHAEVANAVGAAVGRVVETLKILIKPGNQGEFVVHAPWGGEKFINLEEAEEYAIKKGKEIVKEASYRAGAGPSEVLVSIEKSEADTNLGQPIFLQTSVLLTAVGRPRWVEH